MEAMSGLDDNGYTVRYSAKELFARIDTKLDVVVASLAEKADHADVTALEHRIEMLEKEAGEVRAVASALLEKGNARFSRNEKLAGLLFAVVTTGLNVMTLGPDVVGSFWP